MTSPTERRLRELFAADATGAPDPGGLAARALHTARRRRRARATAAAWLVAVVAGAGGLAALWTADRDPGAGTASSVVADCEVFVRFADVTYRAVAMASSPAALVHRLGDADRSSCEDVGPDPRGGYFPDEPARVAVWAYAGYDPRQVVAIPAGEMHVHVLVAVDLPAGERQRVTDAVRLDAEG